MRPFLPYRTVQTLGLRYAAARLGIDLDESQETALADALPTWKPWGETIPTLTRLREDGWKLAILTNSDKVSIDKTLTEPMPFAFDDVIAADEVESYKPEFGHFEEFGRRHDPALWIHIGLSIFHDVRPIHRVGHRGILIDRDQDRPHADEADASLSSLTLLPEALKALV